MISDVWNSSRFRITVLLFIFYLQLLTSYRHVGVVLKSVVCVQWLNLIADGEAVRCPPSKAGTC